MPKLARAISGAVSEARALSDVAQQAWHVSVLRAAVWPILLDDFRTTFRSVFSSGSVENKWLER
eukprot:10116923-Lingulodinium_polyedra.AAC.1